MAHTHEFSWADIREATTSSGLASLGSLVIQSASNCVLHDVEGREYLDLAGGLGVCNVGHNHPKVVQAVTDQAKRLLHSCFHVGQHEPYLELCQRLAALPGVPDGAKAALFNSGAEAVENAIKAAKAATGRQGVLCFEKNFHGRTWMALSCSAKTTPLKRGFRPLVPEVHRIPFASCYRCPLDKHYPACDVACAGLLEDAFRHAIAPEEVACLITEPVTGESGSFAPPPEYFPRIKAICEAHGILFIADEIQSGMGRTGAMLAIEHWGVTPDLTCLAKSLAGGLPLSAVVGRADVLDAPSPGGLGSTFGGNPVACAAALAVLDSIEEEGLLARAQHLGDVAMTKLREMAVQLDCIGDVRGSGLLLAVELVENKERKSPAGALAKDVVLGCREQGCIILASGEFGHVLRMLPPLTISETQLDAGLATLYGVLSHCSSGA